VSRIRSRFGVVRTTWCWWWTFWSTSGGFHPKMYAICVVETLTFDAQRSALTPKFSVFFSLSHFLSSKIPQSNRPSRKRLQISNRLKRTDNPKTFKVLNSQPRENRILISYSCYLLLVFELPVASVNSCWYVHINKWGSLRIQFKSTFSIKYIAKIASGLGPVTAMIFVLISFR